MPLIAAADTDAAVAATSDDVGTLPAESGLVTGDRGLISAQPGSPVTVQHS